MAARRNLAERLVRELADWRTWQEHRELYLWSEYNDGVTDPDPCELRLVDLAEPAPLEHPYVVALLKELGEYAAEYAASRPTATGAVTVYDSWAPQQPKRVVYIQATWWSLITRYPRAHLASVGPAVVLMDGVAGAHDISLAPLLLEHLKTIVTAAPARGQPVPQDPDTWFA